MRRFDICVSDYSDAGVYEFIEEDKSYCDDGAFVDAAEALAELEKLRAENEAKLAEPRPLPLAAKHAGTKISAEGVLGRIRDGRYFVGLGWGCGEMLRHLEEMAGRFYAGDIAAVDEFLQLYCLDHKRPKQEHQHETPVDP